MFQLSLPGFSKQIASLVRETLYHKNPKTIVITPPVTFSDFKPVHVLFEEQVALNPFTTCFVYHNTIITFKEVNKRANQLARFLIANGVTANQYVPIYIDRGIEYMIAMLGILKAGGVYVPIDAGMPPERIQC